MVKRGRNHRECDGVTGGDSMCVGPWMCGDNGAGLLMVTPCNNPVMNGVDRHSGMDVRPIDKRRRLVRLLVTLQRSLQFYQLIFNENQ